MRNHPIYTDIVENPTYRSTITVAAVIICYTHVAFVIISIIQTIWLSLISYQSHPPPSAERIKKCRPLWYVFGQCSCGSDHNWNCDKHFGKGEFHFECRTCDNNGAVSLLGFFLVMRRIGDMSPLLCSDKHGAPAMQHKKDQARSNIIKARIKDCKLGLW